MIALFSHFFLQEIQSGWWPIILVNIRRRTCGLGVYTIQTKWVYIPLSHHLCTTGRNLVWPVESWKHIKITRQLWLGFVLATGLNQPLLGLTLFLMMIALYNQCKWKQPHQHPIQRSPDLGEWQEAFKAKALEKCMGPIKSRGHWWRVVLAKSGRNRCRCDSREKEGGWREKTQDQKSEGSRLSPRSTPEKLDALGECY